MMSDSMQECPEPSPPSYDVRKALVRAMTDRNGEPMWNAWLVAENIINSPDVEVRARGTVTNTEVNAALRAYDGLPRHSGLNHAARMRAALEAAREARS